MRFSKGVTAALVACSFAVAPVSGQETGPHGEDVFEAACSQCHIKGEGGAPRMGDRNAWAKRVAQGQTSLARKAVDGIRTMPAHGGETSLSDLEVQRAVAYMVNQSGGSWAEPSAPGQPLAGRSAEQVMQAHCVVCHATGFDGAPRIGDRAAWLPRTALGIDPLVRNVIRGHGGMPVRGGEARLTDAELRMAVIYMISSASTRSADRKANPRR